MTSAPEPPASDDTRPPLVSVLIRSLDRPELAQALDSLALQTHPRIEVVVVAVRPGHRALPSCFGPHPLHLLEADAERPRSIAANVALDAARGDWLLFLDDDDWLMPDHIGRLVRALRAQPQALAAYAGVATVDSEGRPLDQVFDLPFDAVRLLAGNLTPIHAVLFSARLRELGCRFDESLDRYEDWDFWIQVARHTLPVHVPGVSAVYRIHPSSGVHEDAGTQGSASGRIHAKWIGRCTPQQLGALMSRVWSHDELSLRLSQAETSAAAREALLAQALAANAEQGAAINQLRHDLQVEGAAAAQRHAEAVAQMQSLAEQLSAQLARQRADNEQLARQLAEERHRSARLQLDNEALLRSTSWRVTRPLRAVMSLWRRPGGGAAR